MAISVAKGACFYYESPDELTEEQLWVKNGRMVEYDYTMIQNPIKQGTYKETTPKYCIAKYAHLTKTVMVIWDSSLI